MLVFDWFLKRAISLFVVSFKIINISVTAIHLCPRDSQRFGSQVCYRTNLSEFISDLNSSDTSVLRKPGSGLSWICYCFYLLLLSLLLLLLLLLLILLLLFISHPNSSIGGHVSLGHQAISYSLGRPGSFLRSLLFPTSRLSGVSSGSQVFLFSNPHH